MPSSAFCPAPTLRWASYPTCTLIAAQAALAYALEEEGRYNKAERHFWQLARVKTG